MHACGNNQENIMRATESQQREKERQGHQASSQCESNKHVQDARFMQLYLMHGKLQICIHGSPCLPLQRSGLLNEDCVWNGLDSSSNITYASAQQCQISAILYAFVVNIGVIMPAALLSFVTCPSDHLIPQIWKSSQDKIAPIGECLFLLSFFSSNDYINKRRVLPHQ